MDKIGIQNDLKNNINNRYKTCFFTDFYRYRFLPIFSNFNLTDTDTDFHDWITYRYRYRFSKKYRLTDTDNRYTDYRSIPNTQMSGCLTETKMRSFALA